MAIFTEVTLLSRRQVRLESSQSSTGLTLVGIRIIGNIVRLAILRAIVESGVTNGSQNPGMYKRRSMRSLQNTLWQKGLCKGARRKLLGEPRKQAEEAEGASRTGWALVERMPKQALRTRCFLLQKHRYRD